MKKIIFSILLITIFSSQSYSNEEVVNSLKEGGKIIFIRHAYAPGTSDPDNFTLNDCSTQRNLNLKGINQSKKIGEYFTSKEIKIDKVLSSEWCRCKDTAKIAFKDYRTFNALNSFYDIRFVKNKNKQIEELKKYINKWNSVKNLVLITHFVVISEILDTSSSSGEIIISDKDFNLIGRLKISY